MTDDHPPSRKPATRLARAGVAEDPAHGAVAPPLYLSSTYAWADPTSKPAYDYGRSNNPTRVELEAALADLEGGAGAIVTNSGMSAIGLPLCLLAPGDRVIAPHDCYGGSFRLLAAQARRGLFEVEFIEMSAPGALGRALEQPAKLVYFETPSNPLLRIQDLKAGADAVRAAGALSVADNTFLSPARQRPLDFGMDMVVHSTTKFLNGHSDVIGGVLITREQSLRDDLAWWANCTGTAGAPFDSLLTLRGLRTLFVRMDRQEATAARIAEHFSRHPKVERVYYTGLEAHEGFDLARVQQSGPGAVMSIDFRPDIDGKTFLQSLECFSVAASLGGFESLACLPAIMTHAGMPAEERLKAGLTDTLTRFSIGLEDPDDLIADLERALEAAAR